MPALPDTKPGIYVPLKDQIAEAVAKPLRQLPAISSGGYDSLLPYLYSTQLILPRGIRFDDELKRKYQIGKDGSLPEILILNDPNNGQRFRNAYIYPDMGSFTWMFGRAPVYRLVLSGKDSADTPATDLPPITKLDNGRLPYLDFSGEYAIKQPWEKIPLGIDPKTQTEGVLMVIANNNGENPLLFAPVSLPEKWRLALRPDGRFGDTPDERYFDEARDKISRLREYDGNLVHLKSPGTRLASITLQAGRDGLGRFIDSGLEISTSPDSITVAIKKPPVADEILALVGEPKISGVHEMGRISRIVDYLFVSVRSEPVMGEAIQAKMKAYLEDGEIKTTIQPIMRDPKSGIYIDGHPRQIPPEALKKVLDNINFPAYEQNFYHDSFRGGSHVRTSPSSTRHRDDQYMGRDRYGRRVERSDQYFTQPVSSDDDWVKPRENGERKVFNDKYPNLKTRGRKKPKKTQGKK